MPSKRAQAELSDDDDASSSVSKRTRRDERRDADDAETVPSSSQLEPSQNENGTADEEGEPSQRRVSFQDPDETECANDMNEEEKAKWEKEIENIRADHHRQKKGAIAKVGIIQRMELINFMCHKRLTFKFGEQINFIIGHNGSGKSAILTALTIASGSKASATGRGAGVKSFIKEGESAAEVEIVIKNTGPEAFKHDLYGDSITVTRRFTKSGSTYKMSSIDGKVIARTKEELSQMCDCMQLQVDNPLNVLTQDSARQFLSGSHPREKYSLFLRGTGLQKLAEEYQQVKENLSKSSHTLDQKKQVLPDLDAKLQTAQGRVHEAQKAETQVQTLEKTNEELAWAHIEAKEKASAAKEKEKAKAERGLADVEKKLETSNTKLATLLTEKERLSSETTVDDQQFKLEAEKKELQAKIRDNRDIIKQTKTDIEAMNDEINQYETTIRDLEARIEAEAAQSKDDRANKHAGILEKIKNKDAAIEDCNGRLQKLLADRNEAGQTSDRMKSDLAEKKRMHEELKGSIVAAEQGIQNCEAIKKNELDRYGSEMQKVQDFIAKAKWSGRTPVGPLGRFVKLHDQRWAPTLRIQLGGQMSSFLVENGNDRAELAKMLTKSGNRQTQISVIRYDHFDYSAGEPPSEYLTVLRALEVSDPWVERALVNSVRIERVLLEPSRVDGQNRLQQVGRMMSGGGAAWTADLYIVRDYGEGDGKNTIAMEKLHPKDKRNMLFIPDGVSQIDQFREDKVKFEQELVTVRQEIATLESEIQTKKTYVNNANGEERNLRQRLRTLESERQTCNDELEMDAPVNITALQQNKDENVKQKQSVLDQSKPVFERQTAATEENRGLTTLLEKVRKDLSKIDEQAAAANAAREKLEDDLAQAKSDVAHWEKRIERDRASIAKLTEEAQELSTALAEWTKTAEDHFQRFNKPRSVDKLIKEVERLKGLIKATEEARGYTLDESRIELQTAKDAYEKARDDIKEMQGFLKALGGSVENRLKKWHEFRKRTAIRTKELFQLLLSKRGYGGTLGFNHKDGELILKVWKDDQAGRVTKDRDPRGLSGGEKSYSTICLLLALWRSLECPMRCLDEFDVFMDSVNRKVSMGLMIDEAKSTDHKQHILITPLTMETVPQDSAIKIQKLMDPERNQGTID